MIRGHRLRRQYLFYLELEASERGHVIVWRYKLPLEGAARAP
jgi:hypothetical protein